MKKKVMVLMLSIFMLLGILAPVMAKTSNAAASTSAIQYAPYKGVDFMNADISAQRKAALKKAMQMVTVMWTCPADFPAWRSSDNTIGSAVATDGTIAKKFIKGKTYGVQKLKL